MKYYGKAQETVERILKQFETGNVPEVLKQVFVERSDNIPSASWSFQNQFIQAIFGTCDSRGFRQWQNSGRKVKKGAKAFHILVPLFKKWEDEEGNKKQFLYGFKSAPVFAFEDTEDDGSGKWEESCRLDVAEEERLQALPLRCVADAWGLSVQSYNGKGKGYLGYYKHGTCIALGTENLSTWAHELVHAADDKNGLIAKTPGQDTGNEIVAELGGAVILKLLGEDVEADLGGAWEYIKRYSDGDKDKAIKLATKLIDRICKAVNLILETHDKATTGEQIAA